jgi:hypothetical protein
MPKRYTAPFLKFDHVPSDDELVWLLGECFCSSPIVIDESGPELTARPNRIPMKLVVPCMLLPAVAFICWLWFAPQSAARTADDRRMIGSVTALLCTMLPLMFGGLALLNHYLKARGNYIRADKDGKWLEIGPLQETFSVERILAFTQLTRYDRRGAVFPERIRQYGVLVRDEQGMIF